MKNKINVQPVLNWYYKPEKMILTACNCEYSDPIKDPQDITMELDASFMYTRSNDDGVYLEDEQGFRYNIGNKFEENIFRLLEGEIDEIELYRDRDYLRPQDIIDFGAAVMYDYNGTDLEYVGVRPDECELIFDNGSQLIIIKYENVENIKLIRDS